MTRAARIPYWPCKMKADLASDFVDESQSTFRKRVEDGIYPPGRQIGGNRYWFREELEAACDKLRGNEEPSDPFMEAIDGNREA